jgi:cytidylate kinase
VSGGSGVFCVAIDGPAAAGKGTIARALADRFGLAYLDTGSLYRATGVKVLALGGDPADPAAAEAAARSLSPQDLGGARLRTAQAGEAASVVAAIPAVRAALLDFQRDFSRRPGGAVLDGRDIGTVVRPDADVKLYVTASAEARAARRAAELAEPFDKVLDDVRRRDARDAGRAEAPMAAAGDARLIDTTDLTIEQAVTAAVAAVENALDRARGR